MIISNYFKCCANLIAKIHKDGGGVMNRLQKNALKRIKAQRKTYSATVRALIKAIKTH